MTRIWVGEIYTDFMGKEANLAASAREQSAALFDAALDALSEGDAVSAVERFDRAIALDGSNMEAKHGLVRALEDAGRVDDALRITRELIAADPDDVLAQTRLSMIYQRKGMIAEAEAAAAKAKILGWKQELRTGVSPKTDL
jgi:tetratricopeptide (TPR) repeat protein